MVNIVDVQEKKIPDPTNDELITQLEAELWAKLEELRNLKVSNNASRTN